MVIFVSPTTGLACLSVNATVNVLREPASAVSILVILTLLTLFLPDALLTWIVVVGVLWLLIDAVKSFEPISVNVMVAV